MYECMDEWASQRMIVLRSKCINKTMYNWMHV